MKRHSYFLYITTNPQKTVLYTGVTNNLPRRLEEHLKDNMNERKTFAGKYFCYYLVYYEWYKYVRVAIQREKEIKGWVRSKKEQLIASFNPDWRFLNDPFEIEKGDLPAWYIGDDYWQPIMERKKG
jgi:putative endonuclease